MKRSLFVFIALAALPGALAYGQTPEIFDESDVVAGAQRIDTRYFLATGKWADDGKEAGTNSTEIHCYQAFGFCEVAHAYALGTQSWVSLDSYDVLRWDKQEMIAVDSSPICIVNTLRADFAVKKVSISSTSKGVKDDKTCASMDADPAILKTVFLTGLKDELKRIQEAPVKKANKK
jgi:hypothetical protein